MAALQKLSIVFFSSLSEHKGAIPPLNAALLNPGKVSVCKIVENNPLDHSMLILALQIVAEE